MRKVFLMCFLFSAFCVKAQYWGNLFEEGSAWANSGWVASGGVAMPFSQTKAANQEVQIGDSLFDFNYDGKLGIGPSLEIGRFTLINGGLVFHLFEYTVAYRHFQYSQETSAAGADNADNVFLNTGDYTSRDVRNEVSFNLNFNSIFRITERSFIMTSLGGNISYNIGGNQIFGKEQVLPNYKALNTWNGYITGEIGFGRKITQELFVIPSVELYAFNFDNVTDPILGNHVMNSRYLPVVFQVKVLLHRSLNMAPCSVVEDDINLHKDKRKKRKVKLF
jgi:hypothetical protein